MSRARRRYVAGSVAVLALIVAGWWVVGGATVTNDGDWVDVRRDDLVLGVEVTGTLKAVDSGTLGPPQVKDMWEYKISFLAPEAEEVEAGTVVVGFDTTKLQQDLREKMAESEEARKKIEKTGQELELMHRHDELRLAEAQARHRKAELTVDVPAELQKGNELAAAWLDLELAETETAFLEKRIASAKRSAAAELAALRNEFETAEQRVREIQEGIDRMSVKAPRAGTVIYVTDWRDEKKKVGDSCWTGQNVIELPDMRAMMAKGQVEEADAGQVAERQQVKLRLDAHPDIEFTGRVALIWRTVQRESWRTPLKVVRLEIELDETDPQRMRPGMRFRGTVETERLEKRVVVPIEAVFSTADGPVAYRRTLFGSEPVPLALGKRNDDDVEVLEGLREGDAVSLRDLAEGRETA